jgi:hypothetical protein
MGIIASLVHGVGLNYKSLSMIQCFTNNSFLVIG